MLQILELTRVHPLWEELANYAEACSWRAGPQLAEAMRADGFPGWERVFAARADDSFAGYCTLTAHDEMPEDCGYTPFVGFVFVDERFRGQRLSGKLIEAACARARELGFKNIYIMSGEVGLYEKYGFEKLGDMETIYGTTDQLFVRALA